MDYTESQLIMIANANYTCQCTHQHKAVDNFRCTNSIGDNNNTHFVKKPIGNNLYIERVICHKCFQNGHHKFLI
jgi:hypothetical protein